MLERLISREPRSPQGPLADLLERYPPYVAPFPGDPATLSDEQARANLDALLAQKPMRLGIIGPALARFGIDLDGGLAAPDPNPFFDRIDRWAIETWPTIGGSELQQRREHELSWSVRRTLRRAFPAAGTAELVSFERWRRSDRTGPDIFYSLLLDLSLALGEVAIRRRPEMYWGLDLTIRPWDDRVEYHMPVLRGVQVPDAADPSLEEAYALEHGLFVSFVNICTSIDPEMSEPTLYLRGMISGYPAVSRRG
jgi:hypothetical protein